MQAGDSAGAGAARMNDKSAADRTQRKQTNEEGMEGRRRPTHRADESGQHAALLVQAQQRQHQRLRLEPLQPRLAVKEPGDGNNSNGEVSQTCRQAERGRNAK